MPGARPAPRHARGSVRQAAPHPTGSAPLTVTARWDLGRGTQPLPGTQAWRCLCAHLFISTARSGPSWGPRLGHRPTCCDLGPTFPAPAPTMVLCSCQAASPPAQRRPRFRALSANVPTPALPLAHACWQDSDLGGTGPHPRTSHCLAGCCPPTGAASPPSGLPPRPTHSRLMPKAKASPGSARTAGLAWGRSLLTVPSSHCCSGFNVARGERGLTSQPFLLLLSLGCVQSLPPAPLRPPVHRPLPLLPPLAHPTCQATSVQHRPTLKSYRREETKSLLSG